MIGDSRSAGAVSDAGKWRAATASRTQARYEPMAATRGDEAAVPASSKAPRVAGIARRRGALLVAMTSRLVRAPNGFDCIDPLTVPLHDPVKGHLSGHAVEHWQNRQ